jgi:nucleotidyltransferase/DNA polymerase involved in DNA repair
MALIAHEERELGDLSGIGRAALGDFRVLGIQTVAELAGREGDQLYAELCERTGAVHDICVLDVMRCAVAQARDAELPAEQRQWWWWSRARKAGRLG